MWAHIQPEMLSVSTELALSELLLSGCTTASDHHYLFPSQLENAIDIQVEASSKVRNASGTNKRFDELRGKGWRASTSKCGAD